MGFELALPGGLATAGADEPHRHNHMFEIHTVVRGKAMVAGRESGLACGHVVTVHPGEEHTFQWSSNDYVHFVVQVPYVPVDKVSVH